jgi:hypothetical protein
MLFVFSLIAGPLDFHRGTVHQQVAVGDVLHPAQIPQQVRLVGWVEQPDLVGVLEQIPLDRLAHGDQLGGGAIPAQDLLHGRREANGDRCRKTTATQKQRVPITATAYTLAPEAMPMAKEANRKMMSYGSRMFVRKRITASVPRMPRPRARLLPMARMRMQEIMPPSTSVCTKEREYDSPL